MILLHNIHKIFSIPKRKNARGRRGKSRRGARRGGGSDPTVFKASAPATPADGVLSKSLLSL